MESSDNNDDHPKYDPECFKDFLLKPNDPHSINGVIIYQITQKCAKEKAICRSGWLHYF
jgi:hypothetical protein